MKNISFLTGILFVLLTITVLPVNAEDVYEIKFATLAPEGTTWMNIMNDLNTEVQQKTNGAVKFKIYPGGQMGDEKDVIRKIRLGQLHSAGFTGNGLGEILPEIRVMEIPFLFQTSNEIDFVVDKMYDRFAADFEKEGYVLLGWAEVGFVHIFTQKPVRSVEDLKGIKMWTWEGDALADETFRQLGVSPISLSVTDVLTSLQTGLVDAFYSSPLAAVAMQWNTKAKYMTMLPITNASGAVLVSKKMFDKIPPKDQAILKEVSHKHLRRLVEASRTDNLNAIKVIESNGVQLVEKPKDKVLDDFEKTSIQTRNKLIGKLYDKDLLDQVINILTEYRANNK